ncbi:tRNA (adenosine(37)-N6)-threonylcarbamoyltransferase complex dimerization subunit type 1 TsaB [Paenibacillus cremeus]|uniref:tRNA (Adenosine(37)-N6)-threonylcarbamoyltransferase complex dimerization subunit type 1 TsaB n=1 Tax=Paenibacillus cremeus TaxID=2163881 RepID=A0A559K8F5_9BACL|nr:tRNA (adenosine(37)-N6)-threonylcarbamoyltransferase complex dimerization subunit type 1 TsaB [Paenibacillus cremeus]TVY08411.1 tRNA (adenosine(37)-N6)-threonylcarbamoyltransferase complex dimerization subunit type 1 TsaB [Paenibacillus cremeus]
MTQNYSETKLMLSVDTSTTSMSVALSRGSELLGEITSKAERNHSLYLVPTIQRVMAEAGVRPKELSAFSVGIGPGSYTGVRIGVTVAKTFAWTHKLALIGVSTLEAMALGGAQHAGVELGAAEDEETIVVQGGQLNALDTALGNAELSGEVTWLVPLIDARRGQAFTALYASTAGAPGWSGLVRDGIRLVSAWLDELHSLALQHHPARIVFSGELELHLEALHQFKDRCSEGQTVILQQGLRARHTAELGRGRWLRGETDDVHNLVPNYTQLAEAEAKLLAKQS